MCVKFGERKKYVNKFRRVLLSLEQWKLSKVSGQDTDFIPLSPLSTWTFYLGELSVQLVEDTSTVWKSSLKKLSSMLLSFWTDRDAVPSFHEKRAPSKVNTIWVPIVLNTSRRKSPTKNFSSRSETLFFLSLDGALHYNVGMRMVCSPSLLLGPYICAISHQHQEDARKELK